MSKGITLHPTKGVNPRLTICPRCGKDGPELILMGTRDYYVTCPSCGMRGYGGFEDGRCPKCKAYASERTPIGDHERIPGSLCQECKDEIKLHRELVEAGGVYWSCKDCHGEGVIKGTSDFAKHFRAHAEGGKYKDPVNGKYPAIGVAFDKTNCPACSPKEDGHE